MQCVTDLGKLNDAVMSRVVRLRKVSEAVTVPFGLEDRRAISYVTLEIDNLLVVGLRQYTKSSLLRSRTSSGVRITASVTPSTPEEAAAYIYKSLKPAGSLSTKVALSEREEVTFRDPKDSEKVLADYAASNLPNIILGVSLNAQVFSEAKVFRHFFAHRAKNTYDAVHTLTGQLGIIGKDLPENLVLRGRPGSGVRLLDGWLADIENFFGLAT